VGALIAGWLVKKHEPLEGEEDDSQDEKKQVFNEN